MDPLYDHTDPDGRRIRLAALGPDALDCITAQWHTLLAAGLDADIFDPAQRDDAAAQLDAGELGELDADLLTSTPSWLVSRGPCNSDGTCCEISELGLVLALLDEDERSAAASAHLDAIAQVSSHLHGAVIWLLGADDTTGTALSEACVACLTDPYPHARTLESALGQLGQQLALAAASWALHVEVHPR
jgi:hypothetical protein